MLQIRLHGRGGQGVVTAAEMLSLAAFLEGHFAQAFPSFGSERTGAPVVAYARIGEEEIRTHEPIQNYHQVTFSPFLQQTLQCRRSVSLYQVPQCYLL